MMKRNLEQVWEQLRGKRSQMANFLEEVTIRNFRGIRELRVPFLFPVTVLAGPNGCGKSSVLFSCVCAYRVPGAGIRDYQPGTLFPNLKLGANSELADNQENVEFEYHYLVNNRKMGMMWSKRKQWNKSFMGQIGGAQPERDLYIRTLANLTSPSEIRSFLQIGNKDTEFIEITSDMIAFAQRILPYRYQRMALIKKGEKDLLFAVRDDGAEAKLAYSEFHMSAGERAILRMSKDISKKRDALILIDEIEAGMHPYTQQQVMLEIQRLALRNNLQVIVTSHSPVILDCVPVEGRIFLERTADNVSVKAAYRDIIQKAFYGQSMEKLSILCEDEIAEGIIRGALITITMKLDLRPDDIVVGKDTGKDQFAQHIEALGKFSQLDSFLFVLDGDARYLKGELIARAKSYGSVIEPLFLPGDQPPEQWIWEKIRSRPAIYGEEFGLSSDGLLKNMAEIERAYAGASDKPGNVIKNKLQTLAEQLATTSADIAQKVGCIEAQANKGEMAVFLQEVETEILKWRSRR
ncbi:MAG: AAA family ATPase [Firmicutes bacterium]|nr:AAA family ATPase [Bacillota bacterium]